MPRRQYTVTPGQQYDREGAQVECSDGTWAQYGRDGGFVAGQWPGVDADAVGQAVRDVLATREPRTIVLGTTEPRAPLARDLEPLPVCARCGTVCYGDCRGAQGR